MTWVELVHEEAANYGIKLTDYEADYALWQHTGFPDFWTGTWGDAKEPVSREETFRRQLRTYFAGVARP